MKTGAFAQARPARLLRRSILGLVSLLVLVIAGLYGASLYRLQRKHPVPAIPPLRIPAHPDALARGGHLATSLAMCTVCHGPDLGGKIYLDAGPLGIIAGPNLTRGQGGIGAGLTTTDWVRALRYGVRRDGTSLVVMPSETFVYLTEEDLVALIAYLQQLPPVDRHVPPTRLGYLGRGLLALGKLPLLVAEKTPRLPLTKTTPPDSTLAYGEYLANIAGCRGCHGKRLSGGGVHGPPGTPPASNLTRAGIGHWREADFVGALRRGQRPDGRFLHPSMPWQQTALMTDAELQALWRYLRSVPPREFGNR
jgi:cytochrome c553